MPFLNQVFLAKDKQNMIIGYNSLKSILEFPQEFLFIVLGTGADSNNYELDVSP